MKRKKQTLLWELKHLDKQSASYIFGTMHVKDADAFGAVDIVCQKIDEVEVLANEFDFAALTTQRGTQAMELPEGVVLEDLIKPKIFKQFDRMCQKEWGMPATVFRKTLPLVLTNFIGERILKAQMPVSLDETLYRYALEQGKETAGIETYQEQIETLQRIPLKYQVKTLEWTIKNRSAFRKEIKKLRTYYQQGAIDKLYKSSQRSLKGMRKVLLYHRNVIMAQRIVELTEQKNAVCAIGAAHLWGKKGVLRLVKKAGVEIRPIRI